MRKGSLIGIIIGAAGLVVITAGIAGMYGYNKASENKPEKSINEVISDNNKSNIENKDNSSSTSNTVEKSNENIKTTNSSQQGNSQTQLTTVGQGNMKGHPSGEDAANSNKNISQNSESNSLKSGKKIYTDKLDIANQQAKQIDNQLETDGSLVQGQMNGLAAQKYKLYDNVLNEMYQYLQKNLPSDRAKQLKDAQINWIEYKEKEIKAAWPQQDGTMGPLVMNSEGATLTKERCYKILDTYFE